MIFKALVRYLFLDYAINSLFSGILFNFKSISHRHSNEISPGEWYSQIQSPGNEMVFLNCRILDTYQIANSVLYGDRPSIMVLFTYESVIGLRMNSINHTTIVEPLENLRAKYVF